MSKSIVRKAELALILGVVVASACSTGFRVSAYSTVDDLMAVSEDRYRTGKCQDALLGFRQVVASLPLRDSVAVRARFFLAECQLYQSQFLEAARQFRRVADEAPNHPLAARGLLRSGDAQSQLWKRAELDPTYGQAAAVTYQEVMARYPRSEVFRRANLKLLGLSERFAEKEFKNGEYYFKFKAYDSAILYYRAVVAEYGSTSYAPLSLIRLVEIYQLLGYEEEEGETCANLRRFYPSAPRLGTVCRAESTVP